MQRPLISTAVVLLSLVGVLACTDADQNEGTESRVAVWAIGSVPTIQVGGGVDGGHDLFRVRGAVALDREGLAVLNAGTFEVRRFDPAGTLRDVIGRAGEGPGEFRAPIALGRSAGDTLLVYDLVLRRLSRFGPDGGFVDDRLFEGGWASPSVGMLVTSNGDLLATDLVGNAQTNPVTGIRRHRYNVWRILLPEGRVDSIGGGPGAAFLMQRSGGSERATLLPFSSSLHAVASQSHTFLGDSQDGSIRVYTRDGDSVTSFLAGSPARPITPPLEAAMVAWRASVSAFGDSATVAQELADAPLPKTLPAFSSLVVDEQGWLWVGDTWTPGVDSLTWEVRDPSGGLRAKLQLPADFRPTEIGTDQLVGIRVDGDGVERVERLTLDRRSIAEH